MKTSIALCLPLQMWEALETCAARNGCIRPSHSGSHNDCTHCPWKNTASSRAVCFCFRARFSVVRNSLEKRPFLAAREHACSEAEHFVKSNFCFPSLRAPLQIIWILPSWLLVTRGRVSLANVGVRNAL